jgi:hypothetical protein
MSEVRTKRLEFELQWVNELANGSSRAGRAFALPFPGPKLEPQMLMHGATNRRTPHLAGDTTFARHCHGSRFDLSKALEECGMVQARGTVPPHAVHKRKRAIGSSETEPEMDSGTFQVSRLRKSRE